MSSLDLSVLKNQKRKVICEKLVQEELKNRKVKQLDKIIDKTDKLLKKAKNREEKKNREKPQSNPTKTLNKPSSTLHILKPDVSILDYQMLNRLPKGVMDYIFEKHKEANIKEDGKLYICSYEMKEKLGKSASHISNTVQRLEKRGFIKIHQSRSNGMREVSISKSLFT